MQEELAELRPLPGLMERLRNDNRNMFKLLRELQSAVGSLQADATQRSVRVIENQALFEGRVTSIMRAGGLPIDTFLPPMYLGERPNPRAMTVADLGLLAEGVYGDLVGGPEATTANTAPIPPIQQEVRRSTSAQGAVDMSQVACTDEEMVVDSRADDGQPTSSRPIVESHVDTAGPIGGISCEAPPLSTSEMQPTPVGADGEIHIPPTSMSCPPVTESSLAIPTDPMAKSPPATSAPNVIVVAPLQHPLSPIMEVAEEPSQFDVHPVNQAPTTDSRAVSVTDIIPPITATDIAVPISALPIPVTDIVPPISATDITVPLPSTDITALLPVTDTDAPISATDNASPLSAMVVPPPSVMVPEITSPTVMGAAPALASSTTIPMPSALAPPSAGHRNGKRARSSSVVSTRSSKRLRGETPA